MANMCDNHLDFTCKVIPSWFKVDPETSHGIHIDEDTRFLFLYEPFDKIVCENRDDGTIHIEFGFETKWSPPDNLYEKMLEDENILSLEASWYEPGCMVIGYVNQNDGIVHEDCPNEYYSEILDVDVIKEEPCDTYIDMHGDNYILLSEYLKMIRLEIHGKGQLDQQHRDECVQERKEIKEYFK